MADRYFGWGRRDGAISQDQNIKHTAVSADFMLNLIAYNLVRIPKLIAA